MEQRHKGSPVLECDVKKVIMVIIETGQGETKGRSKKGREGIRKYVWNQVGLGNKTVDGNREEQNGKGK